MNLESYKYFIAAAEELNFTKAAKRLYMTQQALSKQIDKLEKCYNARLFNREPPMSLTPAGECLYRHMCRILDDERQMRSELDSILKVSRLRLIIGVSYYRSSVLLPELLAEYHQQWPEVMVEIRENSLSKTVEALKLGKVDLMFGYEEPEDPTLVSIPVLKESVVLLLPKVLASQYFSGNELDEMKNRESVSLKQFAKCPFVRLVSNSWLGMLFDKCCEEEGIAPHIVLDSSSIFTMLSCCVQGIGAALVPRLYLKNLTEEQRKSVHVFRWDYPAASSSGAILYLKSSYLSDAAREFVETARKACQTMSRPAEDCGKKNIV